ncbi:MAG: mechanosensitive ion channel domain-containing protein [Usitatibacteraceae bacterium]
MPVFSQNFETLLNQLGTPPGWAQLGIVAAGFLFAWVLARLVREKIPDNISPGALKIGAGSVQRLVVPFSALVFIWLGKVAFAKWHPAPILSVAVLLVAAFALIRISLYLLRQIFPVSPLLKASERAIAYTIWVIAALYLTGLLPEIGAALNEVSFPVGTKKITLLAVIEALLSLLLTLVVSFSIAILIEARVMKSQTLDMGMRVFAGKVIRALALVIAILIALPLMGIDITVLSVFGGALGVGLGLGLQKIASNYVSGFVILLDRSIRPGDLVTITDRHGIVSDIRARYTVVRGLDGTEAIIPNDSIIGNTVLNHSYTDRVVAVKTSVSVAYQTEPEEAMSLILAAAKSQSRVLATPEPTVWIKNLGDNGIELELVAWISDAEAGLGSLRSDIFVAVLRAFREAGIEIPYQQREVRLLTDGPLPTLKERESASAEKVNTLLNQ